MPDRNTSTHSHEHRRPDGHNPAGHRWPATSLYDQYRAVGIPAVAAAMRWPDPASGKELETDRNKRHSADDLPPCLRDFD